MDKIIKLLITLALILFAVGCSSTGKIDYMVAGGATHKGNEIWVQSITFDNSWGIPMGSLGCCWQSAGKTSGDFDLLQDLRNGEDPTYILKGVAYKDLYNPYSDVPVMPSIILE